MIEIQDDRDLASREWEHLVRECGGHPLHLPDVHEAEFAGRDRFQLTFLEGTHVVACALAYHQRGKFGRKTHTLLLPTAPAIRTGASGMRGAVYARLMEFARSSNCRELIIHAHGGTRWDGFPPFQEQVTDRLIEFVLDLEQDEKALVAGMHRVHRKNVRRAEREGVTVEADESLDSLLALRSMQGVSAERQSRRGGGFTVRDRAYFERLHRHVYATGRGKLLLAIRGGSPVAGLAYLSGAGRAITVRSGSTEEGYETYAMYLLQHQVIMLSRARGLVELNLGGVPEEAEKEGHPQHGLYDFKKGFGGTAVRRHAVRLVLGS